MTNSTEAVTPDRSLSALFGLSGKTALVTGGGGGIGRGIALQIAAAGANVIIGDMAAETGEETAAMIAGEGGQAAFLPLDQQQESSISAFVSGAAERAGRIDILVNNAAYQHRAYFDEIDTKLFDKLYEVNLRGPFLLMRNAAREMRKGGQGGRVVNISSLGSVLTLDPGLAAYNALKAGMNGLTRQAALEMAGDAITVNAILPGGTPTTGALTSPGPGPTERLLGRFPPPMGRMGTPEDIGHAALFFASEAASFITGQTLIVDGGFSIV